MGSMTAPAPLLETDRTKLRRAAGRGSFDRDLANSILDEAYIAHVGFVVDGTPRVLPMAYGRIGEDLYLHGAVGNAMLKASISAQVCVTVTLLDALVLARSGFHHSMNYRCVVLYGEALRVDDADEKRAALDAVVDQVVPGRSSEARPSNDQELRATLVLRLPIVEGSVKVRGHGVVDDPDDMELPVWAGLVPTVLTTSPPVQDEAQAGSGLTPPSPDRLVR